MITPVKATIPCSKIENPAHWGDGGESLGIEIHLLLLPLWLSSLTHAGGCHDIHNPGALA